MKKKIFEIFKTIDSLGESWEQEIRDTIFILTLYDVILVQLDTTGDVYTRMLGLALGKIMLRKYLKESFNQ